MGAVNFLVPLKIQPHTHFSKNQTHGIRIQFRTLHVPTAQFEREQVAEDKDGQSGHDDDDQRLEEIFRLQVYGRPWFFIVRYFHGGSLPTV